MTENTAVQTADNRPVSISFNNLTLNPTAPMAGGPLHDLVEWYQRHPEAMERVETRAATAGLSGSPFSVKLLYHKLLKHSVAGRVDRMADYIAMHLSEYPGVRVGCSIADMLDRADVRGHKSHGLISCPADGGMRKYLEIKHVFQVPEYQTTLTMHADNMKMVPSTFCEGSMPSFTEGGQLEMRPVYKIGDIHIYPFNKVALEKAHASGHNVIGVMNPSDCPSTALPIGLVLMHKSEDKIYDVLGTDIENVFEHTLWATILEDWYTDDMVVNEAKYEERFKLAMEGI